MIATRPRTVASDVEDKDCGTAESICLPGQGLTLTELLRVLDVLRRRVARESRGREGAFAGFDSLDVSRWRDCGERAPVLFTARVVSEQSNSQVVEYLAYQCSHTHGNCHRDPAGDPYVVASGRTVGLGQKPSDTDAVLRFSIATPNR